MHSRKSAYFSIIFIALFAIVDGHAQLTNLDYEKLVKVRKAIKNKSSIYLPAYKSLLAQAEKAMVEGPFSVMQKKQVAASGDKHDYLSLAPYWWPDPEKEDGLPWIRKDGVVNPMTRGSNVDDPAKDRFINNVKVLSLAYFFSGKNKYARKVKQLLRVWFLDEETRMNSNLNYAQGIPGKNTGRGFGIIEFSGISHIITAIEILELKNKIPIEMNQDLRTWLNDYLMWLQTSEFGVFEKTRTNNHGSLYDVQVVSLLRFLEKNEEAKTVLNTVFNERIEPQIIADGSQPHELKRTKALSYSILNLSALTKLAYHGRQLDVDIWGMNSDDGDLMKAFDFLFPYIEENKIWPYEQMGSMNKARERLRRMFVNSGSLLDNKNFCAIRQQLEAIEDIQQLIYPCTVP